MLPFESFEIKVDIISSTALWRSTLSEFAGGERPPCQSPGGSVLNFARALHRRAAQVLHIINRVGAIIHA